LETLNATVTTSPKGILTYPGIIASGLLYLDPGQTTGHSGVQIGTGLFIFL